MFDKLRPKLVGIISSEEWESEAQVVGMSIDEEGVLQMELEVDGTDIKLHMKLAHVQVAMNEMIHKQNKLVKMEQAKG